MLLVGEGGQVEVSHVGTIPVKGEKNITNKRDKYISIWGNEITLTNTSKSKLELKSHTFQAYREKGMKTETCI